MTADAESGSGAGNFNGFMSGGGAGHKGGAGDEACAVEFEDGTIDAGCQPKIVSVDNETAHGVSVSTAAGAKLTVLAELAELVLRTGLAGKVAGIMRGGRNSFAAEWAVSSAG